MNDARLEATVTGKRPTSAFSLKSLADRRPSPFALLVLLAWVLISAAAVAIAAALLERPLIDVVPQSIGSLVATASLLILFGRWGWVGFTRRGGRSLWLLTAVLAIYTVIAYQLAFFGDIHLLLGQLASEAGREILWRQTVVGFVEETLFRGLLLYVLVRVWGGSRRGTVAAVAVTALLFGALHFLQVLGGSELWQVALTILNGIVAGFSLGELVLWGGTIWPAVLLHGLGNAAVQLPFINNTNENINARGIVLATLAELAIVIVCWALLWRRLPRPTAPEIS